MEYPLVDYYGLQSKHYHYVMANDDNSMRKRAKWMVMADDPILETLRDLRASSPTEIADKTDYSREHINRRLRTLYEYQLVDRPSRGLYRITESAESYLEEELDASNLDRRNDG